MNATLIVGLAATVAAIVSAVIAALSARAARQAESEAHRLDLLERRLSERKYDTYKQIIDLFGQMLAPGAKPQLDIVGTLGEFTTWITVTGSVEAVKAFGHLMQSTFHNAPAPVMLRLFSEFQIAARRDMGDPDTGLGPVDLLAMRINDLFGEDQEFRDAMTKPFEVVCQEHGWTIPWST